MHVGRKLLPTVLGKISCDELKIKPMDIKQILNDALNKALITDRIKGVPSSNKIADFVNKYVESEQLILPVVVRRSGQLIICKNCGSKNMYQYTKSLDKCDDCGYTQNY